MATKPRATSNSWMQQHSLNFSGSRHVNKTTLHVSSPPPSLLLLLLLTIYPPPSFVSLTHTDTHTLTCTNTKKRHGCTKTICLMLTPNRINLFCLSAVMIQTYSAWSPGRHLAAYLEKETRRRQRDEHPIRRRRKKGQKSRVNPRVTKQKPQRREKRTLRWSLDIPLTDEKAALG